MKNAKVATRTAVICYGLGDLASQFVWSFVGSYLTIFLHGRCWPGSCCHIRNYDGSTYLGCRQRSYYGSHCRKNTFKNLDVSNIFRFRLRASCRFFPYLLLHILSAAILRRVLYGLPSPISLPECYFTLVNIPYGALVSVMTEDSNQRNQN